MARNTYLQLVSDAEIAALRKAPDSISKLDKPEKDTFSTYLFCSINYFLTGDAYPSRHKLAPALCGTETIETAVLEDGSFSVVPAARAKKVAEALAEVDLKKLEKKVGEIDFEDLADEEIDDLEILEESDDPAAEIKKQVKQLVDFYQRAAEKNLGVAIYTT